MVCSSGLSPGALAQPRASGCSTALLRMAWLRLHQDPRATALAVLGAAGRRWSQVWDGSCKVLRAAVLRESGCLAPLHPHPIPLTAIP